jgi:hypothetical protein
MLQRRRNVFQRLTSSRFILRQGARLLLLQLPSGGLLRVAWL